MNRELAKRLKALVGPRDDFLLHNPKVLSRSETPPALSTGAAWQSDEASGFVRIIPTQPGRKGLDVTAGVIATDAKECKGKFASARKSELIDSAARHFLNLCSIERLERSSLRVLAAQ